MAGKADLFTKVLVVPLAKGLLRRAGLEDLADSATALLNDAARRTDAELARQEAARLAEDLVTTIVARHAATFEADGTPVRGQAVAEALGAVIVEAATPEGLLARNLDPRRLAEELAKEPLPGDFGVAERELYESALPDLAAGLVARAADLKEFEGAFKREVLDRLPTEQERRQRRDQVWLEYEHRYCAIVRRRNNLLELFGSDLPAEAREQALSAAYVTLRLTTKHGGDGAEAESVTADHLFRLVELGTRLIVVRGEAGGGKTTLLRWAAMEMASLHRRGRDVFGRQLSFSDPGTLWRRCLPVLIRLRDCPGGIPPVHQFIADVERVIGPAPEGWLVDALTNGDVFVMLDGVDEVAHFDRPRVAEAIGQLVAAYPKARFVVTTRPAAVPTGWLARHGFAEATIAPLTAQDQGELIGRWHHAMATAVPEGRRDTLRLKEQRLRDRLDDTPSLARLGSNPLMLAMLCALNYRIESDVPDRAFELCDKLCTLLVDEKDRESRLRRDVMHPVWAGLDGKRKRALMRELAFYLVDGPGSAIGSSIRVETADRILSGMLESFGHAGEAVEPFRCAVVERCGLLRDSAPGRLDFLHNTLKEFLAAEHFIEMRLEDKLAARARNPEWRNVLLLAAGGGPRPFVDSLFTQIAEAAAAEPTGKVKRRLQVMAWAVGTVAVALSPALRARHAEVETTLIPPKTVEEAELLAEAGEQVLDPLIAAKPRNARSSAATVRALLRIGSGRAKAAAFDRCGSDPRKAVIDELVGSFNPLALPSVQRRLLEGMPLENGWRRMVTDASPLVGVTGLQTLDLSDTMVGDLGPLASLTDLEALFLGGTPVDTVEPLSGLVGLTNLDISNTSVADISPLAGLVDLCRLNLSGLSNLWDISTLAGFRSLQMVELYGTGITDLSPLAGLKRVEILGLGAIRSVDLGVVGGLTSLRQLSLRSSGITDLSPLATLIGLEVIELAGTDPTNLWLLDSLPNLRTVIFPDGTIQTRSTPGSFFPDTYQMLSHQHRRDPGTTCERAMCVMASRAGLAKVGPATPPHRPSTAREGG